MQKCLGKDCPNHCCSNKFKGLSKALRNDDDSKFVQIQLDDEEVQRIVANGRNDLVEIIDGNYFIKLNEDFSCCALENGKCSIYDVRPNVCKTYPYYFDQFCGLCIDKNCPGNFDLNVSQDEIYDLLKNRIKLYSEPQHFFFDGYDIDNSLLGNAEYISEFLNELNDNFFDGKFKVVLIPYFDGKIKENGGISGIILGENFHFTCHTFSYKNTMFIDCYGPNNINKDLFNLIIKYFNTNNFDLCKHNYDKKGHFGKHVIINCPKHLAYNKAISLINDILKKVEMTPICDMQILYQDNDNFDILQPIAESHISIHKSSTICVIDIFSCKFFDETKILKMVDCNFEQVVRIQRGVYYK